MTNTLLCRICGQSCREYVNIFDDKGSDSIIGRKIISCLQIPVAPEDVLPLIVCYTCNDKLDSFHEFFQMSHRSQIALYQSYQKEANAVDRRLNLTEDGTRSELCKRRSNRSTVSRAKSASLEKGDTIGYDESPSTPTRSSNKRKYKTKKSSRTRDERLRPGLSRGSQGYLWPCTICDTTDVRSFQKLCEHYKTEHDQPPIFKCVSCDKRYNRYKSFTKHYRLHRDDGKYPCELCGKSFSEKSILRSHRSVHSDERPHSCLTCGKSFKNLSSLSVHRKLHIPDKGKEKFLCDICKKEFSTKYTLKVHRGRHTGERNFMCDICGRCFVAKGSLAYHLSSHTTEKNYKCASCDRTFKTAKLLGRHETVHSVIKPHQCDACGKQFRERSGLREHTRTHTGAMPYSCEYCGKRFRFSGILVIHRRQHTGEKPYACDECQRFFTNWSNYNKHMKHMHQSGSNNLQNN